MKRSMPNELILATTVDGKNHTYITWDAELMAASAENGLQVHRKSAQGRLEIGREAAESLPTVNHFRRGDSGNYGRILPGDPLEIM